MWGDFRLAICFFLGENVPHVFRSDPEYFEEKEELSTAGNTIFFDFAALGTALGELEDLQALRKFKDFSGLCFQVLGDTKSRILEIFERFSESLGLARFQLAIQLLSILDQAGDSLVPLNRPTLIRGLSERDGKRMDQVMQFLLENRFRQVSLEEASEKANLSKEAFCRFFKLRTRKTFTQYLQHLRINEAQKLLQETDLGVSEIAFRVGFENLSYFNRSFKTITGKTPREFRA